MRQVEDLIDQGQRSLARFERRGIVVFVLVLERLFEVIVDGHERPIDPVVI